MTRDNRCTLSPAPRFTLVFLLVLAWAHGATAATFTVTSLANSGPGSLRQAVLNANASIGPDEVSFAPGLTGTIALTSGEIRITDHLVVNGPGAGVLTVSGNDASRIFLVENAAIAAAIDVTLSSLTLTRGNAPFGGGAVFAINENLTILNSVISDSSSGVDVDPAVSGCGGNVGFEGINDGALRIADSLLTGGTAIGIGSSLGGNLCVFHGSLLLERSTLSGGWAYTGGGFFGIGLAGDSRILASTITGNEGQSGGGVSILLGNLQIINSTISGNSAAGGGGISVGGGGGGSLLLRLTTVSNNMASVEGGSILLDDPSSEVELDHSIVANGTPQDLAGFGPLIATVTANYSLIEAPGDTLLVGANNIVGTDPLLGPLANNGGPTLTHILLPGSPALDAGNPAIPSPPPTDQRGFARILGPAIDLGSVEGLLQPAGIPTLSQWGLLLLVALLCALGVWRLRKASALRASLVVLLGLISTHGATAATFTVTSLADSGPGTLRQAVLNANASVGPDEITFAPGLTGTITLTSGQILIADHLVVNGPGAGVLTVSANNQSRIFRVENAAVAAAMDVTLSGLTLTLGSVLGGGYQGGGAVMAVRENLTILDSVISDGSSIELNIPGGDTACGGNVGFSGSTGEILRIVNSTLTRGFSNFGGNLCVVSGRLILERSTLSDAHATYSGGGLYGVGLTESSTILLSTISGNSGALSGGGIYAGTLGLTIETSTISGNTSDEGGGAYLGGNIQILNSTISGNSASSGEGGSILVATASGIELDHSIVANGTPQDLAGLGPTTVTANYSLIEAPGDTLLVGANNIVGADPLLGPLANNGGPTQTHMLLPGSPALDAGNPAIPSPPPTDQRGFARILGPAIDLGSVEGQAQPAGIPTLSQWGLLLLVALLSLLGVRRLPKAADGRTVP